MSWLESISYPEGILISDFFLFTASGIQPIRDHIAVELHPRRLMAKINDLLRGDEETARDRMELGTDRRNWNLSDARKDVQASGPSPDCLQPYDYRPFDQRWIYYTEKSRGLLSQPQHGFARQVLRKDNRTLCLLGKQRDLPRSIPPSKAWISRNLMDRRLLSSTENFLAAPMTLFDSNGMDPVPNIHPYVMDVFASRLDLVFRYPPAPVDAGSLFGVSELFHYIYGLLHAPAFRKTFSEYLRTYQFRIPLPDGPERFRGLSALGKELADMHLNVSGLKPEFRLSEPLPNEGFHTPLKPVWKQNRLFLTRTLYIESVPEALWSYRVGSYQVVSKWLKDRGPYLRTANDVKPLLQMLTAIKKSCQLEQQLDQALL